MEPAFSIPAANLAVQILSIAIMIVAPFAAAALLHRRLGVGWRVFWLGALVFVISQMLLRIALVGALQLILGPQIAGSFTLSFAAGAGLALTAALFETDGRYLGYRLLLRREPRSWEVGVLFGLGHGGIESALLVAGVAIAQLVTLLTLTRAGLAALPAPQAEAIGALAGAVSDGPPWMGLAGAWERIAALAFHVAMSVLVLRTFVCGELRWTSYALGAHFLMDFVNPTLIPALLPTEGRGVAQQVVLLLALSFAVWVTLALRPARLETTTAGQRERIVT